MAILDFDHELDVAVSVAREAGRAILGYYGVGLSIERKIDDEPVTTADRAADDLIRARLQAAFPLDGLLTEESRDDLSRLDKDRVWIVDPLDGTTEFITETGDFAVQIALVLRGRPVLGVVYQPTTCQLYHAVRGKGAYESTNGRRQRLRVSNVAEPVRMRLIASRSHYSEYVEAARQLLEIGSVRRVGSVGLKVAMLARGTCDLYLATSVAKEWDICAPHILLNEAGGEFTNLCGEAITYNKAELTVCRGIVGSNGQMHDQIVEALLPLSHLAEE